MTVAKKKLFICITKSNWGGAQKYVFDIATNASKHNFDTTVILGGDGELKRRLDDFGIKTITSKNSQRDINIGKEFNLFIELVKLFKSEKPDIIHLNSSKMAGLGALAGRIAGVKKIIFTVHGWAFNENRNFFSKAIIKILHIITLLLCHETIAVSEITKKQMCWPFNKKIVVIRNGIKDIDLKNKNLARELITEKILVSRPNSYNTLAKDPIWVGTISELHTNKGIEYAIKAISKINKNIIFVIIGDGEKEQELKELAIKLGVFNRIFFVGRLDLASSFLKAFDIFTLSSITEALPYVLLEAGYASLPVIASDVGGIPEIIENNKNGILICPKNSEDIKNSIEDLIKHPDKANKLGETLKEKISKEFSEELMLKKTFALYRKQ